MRTIASYYRVDQYAAGDKSVLFRSTRGNPNVPSRGMVFLTGSGSAADQSYWTTWLDIWAAICAKGITVYAIDGGGSATWGNATAVTRIGQAVAYMKANFGVTGDVLAAGYSMGGIDAQNWAARNLADCAGFLGFAPVTDLDWAQSQAGMAAAINTAYGGNYAANSAGYDPIDDLVDELSTIPWHAFIATDDTNLRPSDMTAMAAAVDGTWTGATGGHVGFIGALNQYQVADVAANMLGL
jgi:pimeloyl-ACP methyl ester carboxylesterase